MERPDVSIKIHTTLENLCDIAIAVSFWERQDVKNRMRRGFSGAADFNVTEGDSTKSSGQKVIEYIFKELDLLHIPENILLGIKAAVVKIGQRLVYWREFVTRKLKLESRFAENIFWTPFGDIDELRIVEEFWLVNQRFLGASSYTSCTLGDKLGCIAAQYGQEDFVDDNVGRFLSQIYTRLSSPQIETKNWNAYGMICVMLLFCASEKKYQGVQKYNAFKTTADKIPARELFILCVMHNFDFGAKYFWEKLNDAEKSTAAFQVAWNCLEITSNTPWEKEKSAKLLCFLFTKMTEEQRTQFINKNYLAVLKRLMPVWPLQELCVNILNKIMDVVNPDNHETICEFVMKYLSSKGEPKLMYLTDPNIFRRMLQILLDKISKELKIKFFWQSTKGFYNLQNLYQSVEYDSVAVLLTDEDLKPFRNEIIGAGTKYFKISVMKQDYKKINMFIRKAKLTNEEVQRIKQMNLLNSMVLKGVRAAEDLLNWLCDDSVEKKTELKAQLDAAEICFVLLKTNKFKMADEFLEWKFTLEEERRRVKDQFKSDVFISRKIFEIWGGAPERYSFTTFNKFYGKCTELLKFFFPTKKEIKDFKRIKLNPNDPTLVEKYWDALFYEKTFDNFEEFLRFCLVKSDDEVYNFQKSIRDRVNWWIDTYFLDKGKFEMVDALLDWLYSEIEKKSVIRNYMHSLKGALLCVKIFKNCEQRDPAPIIKFFNSWIERAHNFLDLRFQLEESDLEDYRVKSCIEKILEEREQNKLIDKKILMDYFKFKTMCTEDHRSSFARRDDYDDNDYENDHDWMIDAFYGDGGYHDEWGSDDEGDGGEEFGYGGYDY